MEKIDFYFSFRSPYSWLAHHRIVQALPDVPVEFIRIPVFPPPDFPNDPAANPNKLAYLVEDVNRIAAAYGLSVQWPAHADTDWMRPHAAYLAAQDAGRGDRFALALYEARFCAAKDVGTDQVLAEAAERSGTDPQAVVKAADNPEFHGRVMTGMAAALQAGIFGVPFFIHRGRKFWGNDRLEWLLRDINATLGRPVPDLRSDLFARAL